MASSSLVLSRSSWLFSRSYPGLDLRWFIVAHQWYLAGSGPNLLFEIPHLNFCEFKLVGKGEQTVEG